MSAAELLDLARAHAPLLAAVLAGLLSGLLLGAMIGRGRSRAAAARSEADLCAQHEADRTALSDRLEQRGLDLSRLEGRFEALAAEHTDLQTRFDALSRELTARQAAEAAVQARLEAATSAFAEKEALFRDSGAALKQEFELLANRIFEAQGARHQEKLSSVLSPFRDQIADFRSKVEEVYVSDSRDRASLLTEVRNLQQASERINAETENLTRALKGDVKLQGNWGEMVLQRVLEASGLRAGHEFFLQEGHRSGDGDLKRPDVRIRLPDDKDVVVDAKVSLNAYEAALSAESEEERQQSLKQHLLSLRNHVRRLSEQDYDQLEGVRSLDFVLLFVPIEAAFSLAMEQDQRLFTEAFGKRIVIVSPTTLMMTLRVIDNVWRFDKQNRNAEEIAQKAGALYDKLRGLVEEMETLGRQLATATNTYESAFGKIVTGKGNLVRQVESFRSLGAKVKKPLPRKVLEQADANNE